MKADKQKQPVRSALALGILGLLGLASGTAVAAVRIDGQVQAGDGPVANSTVTLWAASAGEPKQLAQAITAADGSFVLSADETPGPGESLYMIAKGGVPSVNKSAATIRRWRFWRCWAATPPAQRHHQRNDDCRFGLDQCAVPRRDRDQGSGAQSQHRRGQRAEFRRSLRPADGARQFRTRSTAARRRRWPISPRWRTCSRAARRG